MQATETSTAVRHCVQGVAEIAASERAARRCWWWTAITGLGTTHFDIDGWGVDVLIGGSQKAVMIPPGLAYLTLSDRAWARAESSKNPRYYFDLRKERKNAVRRASRRTRQRWH